MSTKKDTLRVYPSRKVKGQWGWTLLAPNWRKVATCGELYESKAHALKMAQSMTKRFAGHVLEMGKGPKKAVKKWLPKAGDEVIVFKRTRTTYSFGWIDEMEPIKGVPVKVVQRTGAEVIIDHGGEHWSIHVEDTKPAPAKRITKAVTNPVK